MFEKKEKKRRNKLLLAQSSPASYPAIETGQTNRFTVFCLVVMFAESQIKEPKRDPEYCKKLL